MSNNSTNLVAVGVGGAGITAALWAVYATVAASSPDLKLWAWPTWVAIAILAVFVLIVVCGFAVGSKEQPTGFNNIRQQSSGKNSPNQIAGGNIDNR